MNNTTSDRTGYYVEVASVVSACSILVIWRNGWMGEEEKRLGGLKVENYL